MADLIFKGLSSVVVYTRCPGASMHYFCMAAMLAERVSAWCGRALSSDIAA